MIVTAFLLSELCRAVADGSHHKRGDCVHRTLLWRPEPGLHGSQALFGQGAEMASRRQVACEAAGCMKRVHQPDPSKRRGPLQVRAPNEDANPRKLVDTHNKNTNKTTR